MILARYLARHFFMAATVVMLLLLALFGFLELADALEDVGQGSYTTADAISTVLVSLPALFIDLLPVATLLGSVLGLGVLANHRELVAMRASGMSPWAFAAVLATIALLLAISAALIQFFVIPLAERQAQEFRSHTLEQTALGGSEFWSRRGDRVIRVGAVDFGRIPRAIEIYELDENGRLARMLRADRADIVDQHTWLLGRVREKRIGENEVSFRDLDTLQWPSFLSPDQVSTLIAPAHALSAIDLYRYLRESRDSGLDTREQQALLWAQLSLPLALFAMILLGLPLVLNSVRTRSAGYRSLIGAAVGIGFYLFQQITGQLAIVLDLQPALTAISPAVLVLAAALAAIWHSA